MAKRGQPDGYGTKKTPPTTVRFRPHLHQIIKQAAKKHKHGQSGFINDAVEFYVQHHDD